MEKVQKSKAKRDPVLYTYVSKTNRKYVDKFAVKKNRTLSEIVNELISAHRLGRPFKLEEKITTSEAQFRLAQAKKKKKLKELK